MKTTFFNNFFRIKK